AIACAVDVETRRRILQKGLGVLAQSPIPPGFFGHDPAWTNPWQRFDLEHARRLLAEAGYPGGEGLPELVFETANTNKSQMQGAELLQFQLAQVGIRMRIEANTWPAFTEKINQNRAQMFIVGWGADYPDAENFLQLLYGPNAAPAGQNSTAFRNEEYDRLYEEIVRLEDTPERYRKIRRMVEIVCEEHPWIFQIHTEDWVLTQPWLRNFKRPLMGEGFWKYLRPDPDLRAATVGD
ncbi:MAG: ABC transporter substrate-binding protein, partial [Planctomycetales bacterium]|nr:ABC transporter substrate-binding protein [Planctomycetales bacterium]